MMRALARALIYRAPREADACPACGSRRLYDLDLMPLKRQADGRQMGFVSGCDGCGLVFVNPLPSDDDQAAFYSPDGAWHGDRSDDIEPGDPSTPHGTSWSRMFEPIRHELPVLAPPPGSAVLDFGCGNGRLLDDMQRAGWDTWGVEPATDRAFDRHHRLNAVPERQMFDLIVCHHVLEHVTNPLALLRQFAAAAKPGGFLLVSVPRLDTLPHHRDYQYVINGRAHITAYTWPCMQTLMARTGWEPIGPPPDRVAKGRGKTTTSRLRVIARRAERDVAPAFASPGDEARAALRRYFAAEGSRTTLERLGWHRLAARQIEARRRSALKARRARRRMVV